MPTTIDTIQQRIANYADENTTIASINTTDYADRLVYLNEAMQEWQEATDWRVLYREFNVNVSTATGNATIVLPSNFRKLASFPKISYTASSTAFFPETSPLSAGQYGDTDKRTEILGNNTEGFFLRIYGVTLSSGASVKVPYYSTVSSLASPANIPEIPNPEFLVKRTLAYVLEAREDSRFVEMKAEADRILANMIDRENTFSVASDESSVKTVEQTKFGGFRTGGW